MKHAKLLLLPGMDGTGKMFSPLLDCLGDKIETEVISYPVDKKLDYAQLTEFVKSRLPQHRNYILLAESFSGPIANSIAQAAPANLKALIFVASFLRTPRRILFAAQYLPLTALFGLPLPEWVIRRYMLGYDIEDRYIQQFKSALGKINNKVLSFRLRQIINLTPDNNKIQLPGLYIQATHDRLVPADKLEDFKERIENLQVFRVGGPHFILQAKPDICAQYILKVFSSLTDRNLEQV